MRLIKNVFIAAVFCLPLASNAALNLELTQGQNGVMPIALAKFAGDQNNVPGNTNFTTVIQKDFDNSGQFKVVMPGITDQNPTSISQIDFPYWQKQGANTIIIGSITPVGDKFKVNFQLINTYSKQPILSQTLTTSQSGLRTLAHHISDVIYQQITGVRGIFSTKIAYVVLQGGVNSPYSYQLEMADADGFNPRALFTSPLPIMSPTWAPDGKTIAYVSFEGNQAAIYLQNIFTGARTRISNLPGINGAPSFSPDGKKLALVLTPTGNPKIYVMDIASRKLMQLTDGYSIDTEPSFSQDGQSIIFTSNRGGTPQVYQYNFASKQVQRLTFAGDYNARPSYLPNNQGFILMHRESGLFGIATQSLDSGRLNVLVQTGSDESPSVAPNGRMIVYSTQDGNNGVLAMVSIDGQIKLRLPARNGNVQEPAWSPYMAS